MKDFLPLTEQTPTPNPLDEKTPSDLDSHFSGMNLAAEDSISGEERSGSQSSAVVSGGVAKGEKKKVSFTIDCGKQVEDKIMENSSLEKFLQERIKVGDKSRSSGRCHHHLST
ncbi:hypothetical protein L6452_27699 [Arctium lappa]|uniref:Uncharacterized protein n=1 Tax=Arctium lappa TaxID=4217 RepID=A0ACB8ZWN8_ARCLA|nr:hypothetical protein L6452_27699 [Arctium lappa]